MKLLIAACTLLVSHPSDPVPVLPSYDYQLSKCGAEMEAYRQALSETNPPEMVEITLETLLSSLRNINTWSDRMIKLRQNSEALAMRPVLGGQYFGPAVAGAAGLVLCIIRQEVARREKSVVRQDGTEETSLPTLPKLWRSSNGRRRSLNPADHYKKGPSQERAFYFKDIALQGVVMNLVRVTPGREVSNRFIRRTVRKGKRLEQA